MHIAIGCLSRLTFCSEEPLFEKDGAHYIKQIEGFLVYVISCNFKLLHTIVRMVHERFHANLNLLLSMLCICDRRGETLRKMSLHLGMSESEAARSRISGMGCHSSIMHLDVFGVMLFQETHICSTFCLPLAEHSVRLHVHPDLPSHGAFPGFPLCCVLNHSFRPAVC